MKSIIQNHFILHRTRFERMSIEFGLSPTVSYLLILLIFVGLSYTLVTRGEVEKWGYIIPVFYLQYWIASAERLQFYKQIYSHSSYLNIRWIENGLIALPFILILVFTGGYWQAFTIVVGSSVFAIINRTSYSAFAIPTPFSRYPFEFTSGFRLGWILVVVLYSLFIISINVDNDLLGLFSLMMLVLSSLSYYQYPEPQYFIWIHKMNSQSFLFRKIRIAVLYSLYLSVPMLTVLLFVWPQIAMWAVLGYVHGLVFLSTYIMAKYSMYPNVFHLPIAIALAIGLVMPPLTLFLFAYLFYKADKNLNPMLS